MINAIRAHLAEFGIVAPVGRNGVEQLLGVAADSNDKRLPEVARACVAALGAQLQTLKAQILEFRPYDQGLAPLQRCKPPTGRYTRRRSDVGDFFWLPVSLIRKIFRSGRDFSACSKRVRRRAAISGRRPLDRRHLAA